MELSQSCNRAREALKVFLKIQKTFSSEKVFWPPEASASEAALLRAKRGKTRSKALKGVWGFGGNPEGFLPSDCAKRSFTQSRNFGGSMPSKLPESAQTARRVPREKQAANRGCSHAKQGWYFRQSMGVTAPAQFRRFDAAEIAKASQKPASVRKAGARFRRNPRP